jgi:hypothetical protein
MGKTKWLRLGVRDPADILRWAGEQKIRQLDNFRYRTIRGRQFVSFRMVPRYAIQIGTSDIVVVAHVQPGKRQLLAAAAHNFYRRCQGVSRSALAALRPSATLSAPSRMAELYRLDFPRVPSRSRV